MGYIQNQLNTHTYVLLKQLETTSKLIIKDPMISSTALRKSYPC